MGETGVNINLPHTNERSDGFTWSVHDAATDDAVHFAVADEVAETVAEQPRPRPTAPIDPAFGHGEEFLITLADPHFCIAIGPSLPPPADDSAT